MVEQQVILKQHADAPRLRRQGVEWPLAEPYLPLQPDRAAICLRAGQYPGQPRQQGAFTAAAWPHQGQYLAGGHLQGGQREQQIFIKVKPKRRGAQHMAVSIVRVHREPPPLSAGLIRAGSQSASR